MKNRLEIAKKLLTEDGVLIVQTDDKEQAYLKVLCDEIFGTAQFETSFFIQVRFDNKTLAEDSDLHKVIETIHIYSKNHSRFSTNKIKELYSIEKFCWQVEEIGEFETEYIGGKRVDIFKEGNYTIKKVNSNYDMLKETWATGSLIRQGGTAAEFLNKYLIDRKKIDGLKTLYKVYNMGEDGLGYRYITGPQKDKAIRGKFYSGIPLSIKNSVINGEHFKEIPIPNLIYNFLSYEREFGNCRSEGGVDIEGGKKPELLLKFLLEYFTNKNDIICDFFAGTGTTSAVAHKMGRKYIIIEQMDYIEDLIVSRLKNVINGDITGISKELNWQGGGSFVYCELKENAYPLIELVKSATEENIGKIKEQIFNDDRIVPYIRKEDLKKASKEFEGNSLDEKKKALITLIDKNKLYVNFSDIDDEDYKITESERKFTNSFYKGV